MSEREIGTTAEKVHTNRLFDSNYMSERQLPAALCVEYRYPSQRLTLTRQLLGSVLATLDIHSAEEFVASACIETLKYLTDGSNDGRNRQNWPGHLASPCSATNQSQRFELSTARMLSEVCAYLWLAGCP